MENNTEFNNELMEYIRETEEERIETLNASLVFYSLVNEDIRELKDGIKEGLFEEDEIEEVQQDLKDLETVLKYVIKKHDSNAIAE